MITIVINILVFIGLKR